MPPPPTPIPLMQHWGVNECGIPAEEVTEDLLMATDGKDEASL